MDYEDFHCGAAGKHLQMVNLEAENARLRKLLKQCRIMIDDYRSYVCYSRLNGAAKENNLRRIDKRIDAIDKEVGNG